MPKLAAEQGMLAYGFSSHVPMPFFCAWSMKAENLAVYNEQIEKLKLEYKGRVQIYRSLEIDYIPGLIGPQTSFIKEANLDYTIGSIHFVDRFADGSIGKLTALQPFLKKAYKRFLQAIFRMP